MSEELPDELISILNNMPNGTTLRIWSSGELIGVRTDRVDFMLSHGQWFRYERGAQPDISSPGRLELTVNFPYGVFNLDSYADDFGGGSFVLDGGRLNGRPLSSRDDTTDNGEAPYDPDAPDKTLAEYMASWDELIREVRESE